MFFPIGDDQVHQGHVPFFSYGLIALNVLIYWYQHSLGGPEGAAFIYAYGCIPAEIESGQDYYTLFTSVFLHGSWMHLLGNMLYMWIFADNIEASIGNLPFAVFYLLGGLVAGLCHIYFNTGSAIPAVGASGALSAVMGAYIVMFPRSNIRGYLIVFRLSVPAFLFLGFWFFQQSQAGYASLGDTSGGIAWWAHIGGFVFGVLGGFLFRIWYGTPGLVGAARKKRDWE
ncbi:rhomboid family intramembrane serine protease [Neolewinella lacunae]|uniref:Rhomboid family intramembrane serine protease n=1 Tax=Neolewinella lacunae TaxID=1517758 RepID=A0A923PRH9_9BACT|nr:rhomboid family intramembrane serine protease [Neolewinella lacunae]MBC6996436.1 rhomboid family intramembrane serine protease [Neolewinella lacunae]MDN3633621.1 rhomboid family intramembrane serine protease [Neolewinella lacunae]